MAVITSVEDLHQLAKRRMPRMFYDYVNSGSWSESTYQANSRDLAAIRLRQRVAVNIQQRNLASTMIDQPVTIPVALAPTGLTGMVHADGEILAAQAAEQFGVPFTLSTMSICSIEDIAERTHSPFWFQLYVMRDRTFMERLIARAKSAQCSALVVTMDLQIMGQRHKDLKNGLTAPPKLSFANMLNLTTKPQWCWQMLKTPRRSFGNIVGHVDGVVDTVSFATWSAQQFDPTLSWDDVKRIKDLWGGKLIVKGIMDVEDAKLAITAGADAIIVSNHGGRQLDGAPSTISVLADVVDAVGKKIEVHMDSGVQSGQDVLKALAIGARGVYIGRAFLYGLGSLGKDGVTRTLEIIRKELDTSMALCGVTDVNKLNRDVLVNHARNAIAYS